MTPHAKRLFTRGTENDRAYRCLDRRLFPIGADHRSCDCGCEVSNKSFALGRLKVGKMNKTEEAYDAHLVLLKHAGEILWHKFEGLKLRLADNTFYTPDFAVMAADGVIECHEIKGYWMDDARAKIKIAADMYPFRFKAFKVRAKKLGGGWETESFE